MQGDLAARPSALTRLRGAVATGQPTVIWGAGAAGAAALALLRREGVEPVAFVDRDPRRHGERLDGVRIEAPAWFFAQHPAPLVVVASLHAGQIEQALAATGRRAGTDFVRFEPGAPAVPVQPGRPVLHLPECGPVELSFPGRDLAAAMHHSVARHAFGGTGRIIVVAHEASRTGAPLIALEIVRWLTRTGGLTVTTILAKGGPLVPEFAACGPVVDAAAMDALAAVPDVPTALARWACEGEPPAVLCNSAETWAFAEAFAGVGSQVVTLMHEYAYPYPKERLRSLFAASSAVIFPAEAMRRQAAAHVGATANLFVLPQGLLPGRVPDVDRAAARRRVCTELGVSDSAVIVLGCGVVGPRKGTDLVPALARRVRERSPDRGVAFAWLGTVDSTPNGPAHWVRADLRNLGVESAVALLGERDEPQDYFAAADLFVLPSREDPFPCVVHEAMAAGLPVIAFADGGGAPEALADGAGVVVPYLDVNAMADAIVALSADAEARRRMGGRARARVRSEYGFDRYGRGLVAHLHASHEGVCARCSA